MMMRGNDVTIRLYIDWQIQLLVAEAKLRLGEYFFDCNKNREIK